uniref:Serpentine receptor class gamma n=1 Tax=Steinernema glaseri TaxID=37863 RepID=A0A1I8ANE5_9BILA
MWASQSMSVVLLAFNRCVEIWKPRYLYESFDGHRTYYWLLACVLYSMIFVVWAPGMTFSAISYAWFYDPYKNIPGLEFIERSQMTIQAFFLCLFTFLSAFVYDYMQFYPVPASVSVGVNVTWQFSNGAPAIIYLVVNKTIRNGVVALLLGNRIMKELTTSVMPTRSVMRTSHVESGMTL